MINWGYKVVLSKLWRYIISLSVTSHVALGNNATTAQTAINLEESLWSSSRGSAQDSVPLFVEDLCEDTERKRGQAEYLVCQMSE